MLPSRSLIAAALVSGAAVLPAVAAADDTPVHVAEYSVEAKLSGEYHMTAAPPDGTAAVHTNFTVTTTWPKVTYRDGVLWNSSGSHGMSKLDGVHSMGHFTGDGNTADCNGTTGNMIAAGPEIRVASAREAGQQVLSPFGGLTWLWNCTGSGVPSGLAILNLPDAMTAVGPFDALVTAPGAAEPAVTAQPVDRTVEDPTCPLYKEGITLTCSTHVEGVVTFTRTSAHDEPPGTVPPPPPPRFVDPPPVPQPGTDVIDLIPGRMTRDASRLHARIRCRLNGCGVMNLTEFGFNTAGVGLSLPHLLSAARKPRRLGSQRITVKPGTTKRIMIRFNKKARRLIKRAGAVRIVVTAHGAVQDTVIVKLPGRRSRSSGHTRGG